MNILYVEDDKNITAIAKALFLNSNYQIVICHTCRDAIKVVDLCNENINVIILDLILPDQDGITLLRHMESEKRNIPVVVTSGFGDEFKEKLRPFVESGIIVNVLNKPFGIGDLMTTLKAIDHQE